MFSSKSQNRRIFGLGWGGNLVLTKVVIVMMSASINILVYINVKYEKMNVKRYYTQISSTAVKRALYKSFYNTPNFL